MWNATLSTLPPVIFRGDGSLPPSREGRTGRVPFLLELPDWPGGLVGRPLRVGPLVQPLAIVAAEEIVGIGDVPVE